MTSTKPEDILVRIVPSTNGDVLMVTRPPEQRDPQELQDAHVTEVVPMFNTQERMIRATNAFMVLTFIFTFVAVVGYALYQQFA
jgi:hypothetical protein